MTAEERKVVFASSLGTIFEWYDFYVYGTLAPIIAKQFFSGLDPTAAFIFTLLGFAAGFFLSLIVVLVVRTVLGEEAFADWGWRLPFLLSIFMLAVSAWIRLSMNESPAFKRMKEDGRTSRAPLAESFGEWRNLKVVLIALVGLTAGQAVVWYTGQFYAQLFLTQSLKVDVSTAYVLLGIALLLGTPFFIVFGTLSDRIGRKLIILAGCLIAALTYFPLFKALTVAVNPALAHAQATAKVVVSADPAECSFQGNPVAREIDFTSSCDIAKRFLAQSSVSYDNVARAGQAATLSIGDKTIAALAAAAYPAKADPQRIDKPLVVLILTVMVIYATMVYGPIAAMLVELFPPASATPR